MNNCAANWADVLQAALLAMFFILGIYTHKLFMLENKKDTKDE